MGNLHGLRNVVDKETCLEFESERPGPTIPKDSIPFPLERLQWPGQGVQKRKHGFLVRVIEILRREPDSVSAHAQHFAALLGNIFKTGGNSLCVPASLVSGS